MGYEHSSIKLTHLMQVQLLTQFKIYKNYIETNVFSCKIVIEKCYCNKINKNDTNEKNYIIKF